jgi:hypothetical protein
MAWWYPADRMAVRISVVDEVVPLVVEVEVAVPRLIPARW